MFDIQPDFQSDAQSIAIMRKALVEYDKLFTGNVIAVGRMKGLGLLSKTPFR